MPNFSFDGVEQTIPDVYATTKVVNQAAAIPPEFNIALLIGAGDRGQPFDVVTTSPVKLFELQNEVNDEYGKDSDIAEAFEYFKKHGGRKAYCLNASDATKGTGELQDVVPASVIDLTAANWGDYSAAAKLKVENDAGTVVITVYDPDDSGIKVISGEMTTLDECVAWFNEKASKYFTAVKHTGASTMPNDFAEAAFSTTTNYVAGTNPDPTADNYDSIIAALPAWITEFDIRLICPAINLVGASQHSVIQSFRDLAISQRTAGKPICILAGGLTGDTVIAAADTTDPTHRATAYNSQDLILVTPGIDSLAPYKSSAPGVMGMLNGSAIAHNLTRDTVVASTLEKKYTDAELELLIDGGIISFTYNKDGNFVAKGVNSLQANSYTWNIDTKTTCLPMQRAIADYVLKYFKESLQLFIGADNVTKNLLVDMCATIWDTLYKNFDPSLFGENASDVFGSKLPYNTDKIEATTEGWLIYISFVPATETNFIGLTVQVISSY